MVVNKRKSLAQNFLTNSHLAALLLNETSIMPDDIVYEIGPGTVILTRELAKRAKRVIAVEKDRELYMKLKKKFLLNDNIILHNADFLKFRIKEFYYKIFANIPFNITSAIIRRIIHPTNPPAEAYLIVQKEAAERFTGLSKTTQCSVLVKPWFSVNAIWSFRRTDFSPVPNVDVVLMHIKKRTPSLISAGDRPIYERFIKCGFGAWRKDLKLNYKNIFSHNQWKRLSRDLGFSVNVQPSELRVRQWLGLFELFKRNIYRY